MITTEVNGGPMGTLGDKERMDQVLHRNLGALWSSVRWEPSTHFVLLATNSLLCMYLHFDFSVKFVAISLGFTVGPALIWTESFNLFQL